MRCAQFLTASLAATILDYVSGASCDVTSQVKVMSFNLRTSVANDPCPIGCWELRKTRAKRLVEKYQPDLIGTQEGAPDQIEYFQTDLSYASTGECAGDCQWNERNSIFYKRERWEVLEASTFALSDTPDVVPSNTWNLQYLRAAVIARFQDKTSGRVVCMLNTHFDVERGQNQSAVLIAKRLSQHCQASDSVILTGDLNALPDNPAVKYLGNQGPIDGSYTPIPLYETLTAAGVGGFTWIGDSFGSVTNTKKIDYIFARRDDHTCLQNGLILTDTFDGYSSSDHAVIQSEFCIGAGCSSNFG